METFKIIGFSEKFPKGGVGGGGLEQFADLTGTHIIALSILHVKHPNKHNNQQCNIQAIVKKIFQSKLNLE